MISLLTNVATFILGEASSYFTHKRTLKELKKKAEIKEAERVIESSIDADAQSVIDQKSTWKDEYITLLVTLPIIGAFFPITAPYVKQGFELLRDTVPEWYVMLYATVVLAIMGVRIFHKYVLPKVKK